MPPWTGRLVRGAFVVACVALLAAGVASQWSDVRRALGQIGVLAFVAAQAAVLLGLLCSALSWRAALADLGSPLPALSGARVFFVGQLGKYLPGSVWPVLAQMQLGKERGVPRARVGAAALTAMAVMVTTGVLVAGALLPLTSPEALRRYGWALLALPAGLVLLHPPVLTRLLGIGLRVLKQEPLEHPFTPGGMARATGWALAMWACYGVHLVLLVSALPHGGSALPVAATGAYALAWSAGFLLVVAPAGLGVREGVLVLALSPLLATGPATAVAVLSRVATTVGDLLWAAALARHRAVAQR